MAAGLSGILRCFGEIGTAKYNAAYLRNWCLAALEEDPAYGTKVLLQYAARRQGAPHGFEVASIKAVSECVRAGHSLAKIPHHFGHFYHGKRNPSVNPAMDSSLADFDLRPVLANLRRGEPGQAFNSINVRGTSHKIRSLFLRDLAVVTGVATQNWNLQKYLYCFPIDHWVRLTAQSIPLQSSPLLGLKRGPYQLYGADFRLAVNLVAASLDAGVSPIMVNQGVWFFSHHAVADDERLILLLNALDPQVLQNELELMAGFLPSVGLGLIVFSRNRRRELAPGVGETSKKGAHCSDDKRVDDRL